MPEACLLPDKWECKNQESLRCLATQMVGRGKHLFAMWTTDLLQIPIALLQSSAHMCSQDLAPQVTSVFRFSRQTLDTGAYAFP